MLSSIVLKIKRRENRVYSTLYRVAKYVQNFNIPIVKILHLPLYNLDRFVSETVHHLFHVLWAVPLFKARCAKAGKNLCLPNGIPYVVGGHLKIELGNRVTIGRSTIGASKLFDEPLLRIGNHTTIGYGTVISVAREVVIGDHCMIAPNCLIMDSDDHPVSPKRRLEKQPVGKEDVLPVRIGNNVWIGSNCAILKGVKIGDNSIIGAHSVVTRDVMENCIYAGYPARPTLRNIDKI